MSATVTNVISCCFAFLATSQGGFDWSHLGLSLWPSSAFVHFLGWEMAALAMAAEDCRRALPGFRLMKALGTLWAVLRAQRPRVWLPTRPAGLGCQRATIPPLALSEAILFQRQ